VALLGFLCVIGDTFQFHVEEGFQEGEVETVVVERWPLELLGENVSAFGSIKAVFAAVGELVVSIVGVTFVFPVNVVACIKGRLEPEGLG
jgi:hypothetical protein